MINLINKNCEVEAIEQAFMDKSKTAYPNYQKFEDKTILQYINWQDIIIFSCN